jgi:hypothetical protein
MPSRPEGQAWIVLSYSLPAEPSRKRVLVWRHLRKLGALHDETGIWFLPNTGALLGAVRGIVQEIRAMDGKASAFVAAEMEPAQERDLRIAFNQARREDYSELVQKCRRFQDHVQRLIAAGDFSFAAVEEMEEDLEKRRRSLKKIIERDAFNIEDRQLTEAMLAECERVLAEFVEMAAQRSD